MIKTFLFFLGFFSTFLFSFKISKKFLKIEEIFNLIFAALLLNLAFLLIIANILLYFKIYNLFFFEISTLPFLILSFKEIKELKFGILNFDFSYFYKILLFIFIFILVFFSIEALFTPPLSWDSLKYHTLQSAIYIQKGFYSLTSFGGLLETFNDHPKNFEIFLSIFFLAFKSDFIANLCNFYFLIIVLLSSIILLKEFNIKKERMLLFLLNFITIPAFFIYLPTQYIEISSVALLISYLTFLKLYEKEKNISFLFLSSLSLALAFSFKITNAFFYIVGHFFIFYFLIKEKKLKIIYLLLFLSVNTIFLFHYIKITYKFKNPIYPYPLKIFGKSVGETNLEVLKYLKEIKIKEEGHFSTIFSNANSFEKKMAPYLYTIFTTFSQNHQTLGRPALLYTILGLISLVFLKDKFWKLFFSSQILIFLIQFFNPTLEPLRLMFSISYSRYWLFFIFIFLFLSLKLFEKFKIYELIYILGFFTNLFLIIPPIFLPFHFHILIPSIIISILFFYFFKVYQKTFIAVLLFIFILFTPLFYNIKENLRYYFYLNYYHVSPISKTVFPISNYLNGKKAKINCHIQERYFESNIILFYPLLGRKLENELVYVNPEGKSFQNWFENLKKEKVDFLLFNDINTKDFKWCESKPEYFNLINQIEGVFIYKFNPR